MGIDKFKLKDETMMRALVSMRLFRKICSSCRKPLAEEQANPIYGRVMGAFGELGLRQVYIRGSGCTECDGKGVIGRTKAGEIIITDNKFLSLALEGKTSDATKYWIEDLGGRTLKESAIELMLRGVIGADELERWVGLLDQPEVY